MLHLAHLVLRALARIDVGNVDDGFLGWVEHRKDVVDVGAAVEEVADLQVLQMLIAVQLLIVGVRDRHKVRFVGGRQHGLGVASEVGAGHRNDVGFPSRNELAQVCAELVVRVGGHMMKLVYRDQPVVEFLDAVGVDREAKRRVRANEHAIRALEKGGDRFDFAAVVGAGRVAKVPLGLHMPVRPKSGLGERLVVEAGPNGSLGHDDDGLLDVLILELVERDKHQRAALARRWWRFDEQVLLAPSLVHALLHGPHAEGIGFGRCAATGVAHADRRHGFALVAHGLVFNFGALCALRGLSLVVALVAVILV